MPSFEADLYGRDLGWLFFTIIGTDDDGHCSTGSFTQKGLACIWAVEVLGLPFRVVMWQRVSGSVLGLNFIRVYGPGWSMIMLRESRDIFRPYRFRGDIEACLLHITMIKIALPFARQPRHLRGEPDRPIDNPFVRSYVNFVVRNSDCG
jgi:hypothetical protein